MATEAQKKANFIKGVAARKDPQATNKAIRKSQMTQTASISGPVAKPVVKPKKKPIAQVSQPATQSPAPEQTTAMKCGGKVKTKKYAKGGGVEVRGKTKGRFC